MPIIISTLIIVYFVFVTVQSKGSPTHMRQKHRADTAMSKLVVRSSFSIPSLDASRLTCCYIGGRSYYSYAWSNLFSAQTHSCCWVRFRRCFPSKHTISTLCDPLNQRVWYRLSHSVHPTNVCPVVSGYSRWTSSTAALLLARFDKGPNWTLISMGKQSHRQR